MPCLQYPSARRCKPVRSGQSYTRPKSWSEKPEANSDDSWKESAKVLKSGSYRMGTIVWTGTLARKAKAWSIVPIQSTPKDLTKAEFDRLVERWRHETGFHSSLSKKFSHPSYLTIMAAGKSVLPMILKELERAPDHWFYALRYIARQDIAVGVKTAKEARAAWLEWGRKNHYI
jgi:hypothetical protein